MKALNVERAISRLAKYVSVKFYHLPLQMLYEIFINILVARAHFLVRLHAFSLVEALFAPLSISNVLLFQELCFLFENQLIFCYFNEILCWSVPIDFFVNLFVSKLDAQPKIWIKQKI